MTIICGPGEPTPEDLAAIAEFRQFLIDQHEALPPEDWELDPRPCVFATGQNQNVCVAEGCFNEECCELGWQPESGQAVEHHGGRVAE